MWTHASIQSVSVSIQSMDTRMCPRILRECMCILVSVSRSQCDIKIADCVDTCMCPRISRECMRRTSRDGGREGETEGGSVCVRHQARSRAEAVSPSHVVPRRPTPPPRPPSSPTPVGRPAVSAPCAREGGTPLRQRAAESARARPFVLRGKGAALASHRSTRADHFPPLPRQLSARPAHPPPPHSPTCLPTSASLPRCPTPPQTHCA